MKPLEEVLHDWEAVIGLEVHCALTALETKMFCGCKLEYGAPPNAHTCPVCLGLPGALPVPNKAAIESIVLAGLATNCAIQKRTMFYRKGYLYPDMPKGFQITQGPVAFCMGGWLDVGVDAENARERVDVPAGAEGRGGYAARIGIERIHLEEDAGKMVHVGGEEGRITGASYSLVDYNRAGTPLIEIVTRPDLRTPAEARLFMQKLRRILLELGISDCSMEKGSLRADANISMRRRGSAELGVKTELKNINSFKHLHDGLAYEIRRQAEVLEAGGSIRQETRHWSPAEKRTILMRVKETADDYRMFPDPDLAPYDLSDEFIARVRAMLPELPDAKAARFSAAYGLSLNDARNLVERRGLAVLFERAMALAADKANDYAAPIANLLVNIVAAMDGTDDDFASGETPLTPVRAVALAQLVSDGSISWKQAKEVLAVVFAEDKDPEVIVDELGLKQVSDTAVIKAVVDEVLAANPAQVAQYRAGKTGLLGYFVGQCLRATNGQGNPRVISEILSQAFAKTSRPSQ